MIVKKNKIKLEVEFTYNGETKEEFYFGDTYQDMLDYAIMFNFDYPGAVVKWMHYDDVEIEEDEPVTKEEIEAIIGKREDWGKTWAGKPVKKKTIDSNEL